MEDYGERAILRLENMRDGYGVKDKTEIPFTLIITIIVSLMHEIEKRKNKATCYGKMDKWCRF